MLIVSLDELTQALFQYFPKLQEVDFFGDLLHEGIEKPLFFHIYEDLFQAFCSRVSTAPLLFNVLINILYETV